MWEVKVARGGGHFCVGVANRVPKASLASLDKQLVEWEGRAWAVGSVALGCKEGDVVGVLFDQSMGRPVITLLLNGAVVQREFPSLRGARGDVYPAVSVEGEAMLQLRFDGFAHPQEPKFGAIIPARDIL